MLPPVHPGKALRTYWIPADMRADDVGKALHIGRGVVFQLLGGRGRITADIALRLSAWLGTSPELWLEMQTAWDLWQARRRYQPEIGPQDESGEDSAARTMQRPGPTLAMLEAFERSQPACMPPPSGTLSARELAQIDAAVRGLENAEAKHIGQHTTAVWLRLVPHVLDAFRKSGSGWQTRINAALADWLRTHSPENGESSRSCSPEPARVRQCNLQDHCD